MKQESLRRNKKISQNLFGRTESLTMILRSIRLNLHNTPKIDEVRNVVKDWSLAPYWRLPDSSRACKRTGTIIFILSSYSFFNVIPLVITLMDVIVVLGNCSWTAISSTRTFEENTYQKKR